MDKDFDCVEMKREGARRLQAKLAGMTREEELAYWEAEGRKMLERQAELRRDRQTTKQA